jgi:hypothetical protein
MKLFLVERTGPTDYDENSGFLIRAKDENTARLIASQQNGDEDKTEWLTPFKSKCEEVSKSGDEGVLLRDFHAG